MKTLKLLSIVTLTCVMMDITGQTPTLELTFTAIDNAAYVQLDSIKVMNRSQGGTSTIYYPDTTLSVEITPGDTLLYIGYSTGYPIGLHEISLENSSFRLFQNYPNPVKDQSMISIYLPEDGKVNFMVNDIQGSMIVSMGQMMKSGIHAFRFYPGNSTVYFLTAWYNGMTQSIKIMNIEPNTRQKCCFDYDGTSNNTRSLKASLHNNDLVMLESGILNTPTENETYTFQFATNIPCPGTPTLKYEGQVYNTIQIFSQCWLKENLNVGTMIQGNEFMSDNDTIEKYCYNNEPDSCTKYGGLYQWDEMMQYTTQQGVQGICPSGWHLPTDEEWKVLEGAVDSQYGIGDPEWDISNDLRGYDAGTNLKTTSGWNDSGNGTDLFGFSGLPVGARYFNWYFGFFGLVGGGGLWWTSTEYDSDYAWNRDLWSTIPEVGRNNEVFYKDRGFSVCCLRDE